MSNTADKHRLGVLEHGTLEDISRRPNSRHRPGSRVTSNISSVSGSSSASRIRQQVASSLELLTPEEVMEQQEYDLELEDYGGSSGETTDDDVGGTGRTSEIFRIAEPLKEPPEVYMSEDSVLSEDDDKQLAIYGSLLGDEETLVDSDEEKMIMKEIRAEITEQIRGEMKSELELYKKKREALTYPDPDKERDDEVNEDDPELRAAIIKMRKLDRILSRKVKREKEVKRDRILLQRRLHAELISRKPEGGDKSREAQANTAKFLALTLPPSHNIGVVVDEPESPHPPITPLFATQYVDEVNITSRSDKSKSNYGKEDGKEESKGDSTSTARSKVSQDRTASTSNATEDSQSLYSTGTNSTNFTGKSHRSRRKNFLKRNKELASDAANLIAMTEDEKCRVDNLLINLDALPEGSDRASEASYGSGVPAPAEANPFALMLVDGEGFTPEVGDMRRLEDIDSRLKALMPPAEYENIASTQRSIQPGPSVLFTRTAVEATGEQILFGDRTLQEKKEERTFQSRLREIEHELNTLTSAIEHEMLSPRLTSNQLQSLLDQCALTMKRATNETDALAESQQADLTDSRAALLASTPHLDDNVLQKLLTEARAEMHCSSSRLNLTSPTGDAAHGIAMKSLSENNIRELLQDSRSTSRNMSRASDGTAEDQYSSAISPTTPTWPTAPMLPHNPDDERPSVSPSLSISSGSHPHLARPQLNGYSQHALGGSSTRMGGTDNLNLMSLDEEEMMAALGTSDRGDDPSAMGNEQEIVDRRPFLPDIDPKGSLTAKKSANSVYSMAVGEASGRDSGGLRSTSMNIFNNVPDQGGNSAREDERTPTPHPPNSSRPSSGSGGKYRSVVLRSPVD